METVGPLTLLFAGDVMLNGIMPSRSTFAEVRFDVAQADVAFCNLEIPTTDSRTATTRKTAAELKARRQFILKAHPDHVRPIRDAGFDMVSLGNNHSMDYGPSGLEQMQRLLQGEMIDYAGAGGNQSEARDCAVRVMPDGTRIGLISAMAFVTDKALWKTTPATETEPGVATFAFGGVIGDKARGELAERVAEARTTCDFLVVAVHWGTERKAVPDPYQVTLGRALVDAGADVVWGTHPHVLQGAELYKRKPILYSMGNLISSLPAETGFIKMTGLDPAQRGYRFIPATISGGKVRVTKGSASSAALRRFKGLCSALAKRFPHKNSRPMF